MELAVLAKVVGTSAPGQEVFPVPYFTVKRKISKAMQTGLVPSIVLDFPTCCSGKQ